jgi:hypothetical protein
MDSTIPADLLKLKARLEAWRATPTYDRQPIPEEFRQAALDMTRRYSPSLVRRLLKLDPWRLKSWPQKIPLRTCRNSRFSLCRPNPPSHTRRHQHHPLSLQATFRSNVPTAHASP